MIIVLSLWILIVASIVGFYRVIVGPTIPDRIVAASSVAIVLTMVLVLVGLHLNNTFFLDVALAMAVLLFADVLIMAKYFEHGELHK